jgi:hypothetical protein
MTSALGPIVYALLSYWYREYEPWWSHTGVQTSMKRNENIASQTNKPAFPFAHATACHAVAATPPQNRAIESLAEPEEEEESGRGSSGNHTSIQCIRH